MNSKVILIARLLLALVMIVFGLNKFLHFIPPPELNEAAGAYFAAISSAHLLTIVAVLEILTGLAFLTGKYVALALVINAPIAFNAVLFHLALDPGGIGAAAVWMLLVVILLFAYKEKYSALLKP